jgi:hypothetical protein
MLTRTWLILLVFASVAARGQAGSGAEPPLANEDARMATPAAVNVEGSSLAYSTEMERSNYLRGGIAFISAYDSDVYSAADGSAVGDESYSIWPSIALDQATSRLRWGVAYNPGFTFYQHTSVRNESDQRLGANFTYRLSPHVTMTLADGFTRTSNILNQANLEPPVSIGGLLQSPNPGVIAPIADVLSNTGSAQISYQFSTNDMVGASGTFTELRYPNQAQAGGLFGASARGGQAFYTRRISQRHYFGATYQYQMLLTDPSEVNAKVQSVALFYTIMLKPSLSVSFFGGPQHSDVYGTGLVEQRMWSPEAGGGLGWQGKQTSVNVAAARRISDGGGLVGPVRSYSGSLAVRHQLFPHLTVSAVGAYSDSNVLDALPTFTSGGHTISGSISAQRQWGQHFSTDLAYMRLHQNYGGLLAGAIAPDRNRVWVTLSYQFERAIGR